MYNDLGNFISNDFYFTNFSSMSAASKLVATTIEVMKEIFIKEENLKFKDDLLKGKTLNNLLKLSKSVCLYYYYISY